MFKVQITNMFIPRVLYITRLAVLSVRSDDNKMCENGYAHALVALLLPGYDVFLHLCLLTTVFKLTLNKPHFLTLRRGENTQCTMRARDQLDHFQDHQLTYHEELNEILIVLIN